MRPARFCELLAQTQFSDQSTVTVDVLLLQIGQQVTAAADHLEQTTAAVVVVLIGLQVLGQVVDAGGEQRNLNLRGTGVTLMDGGFFDDGLLVDSRLLAYRKIPLFLNICQRRSKGQARFPDTGHTPGAGPR